MHRSESGAHEQACLLASRVFPLAGVPHRMATERPGGDNATLLAKRTEIPFCAKKCGIAARMWRGF
jgi:hypothetical protein